MQKILLIDSSSEFHTVLRRAIARLDVEVVSAKTLGEARLFIKSLDESNSCDLILADLSFPDGEILDFLAEAYQNPSRQEIPVILVTDRTEVTLKVAAFSFGVEDYVIKSVNLLEFAARIEARLKKSARSRRMQDVIRKGALVLQTSLLRAFAVDAHGTSAIDLTTKEFKLLAFLALNEGRVYSRGQLVRAIWGDSVHVLDRTVDSHICSIRKKLKSLGKCVECLPGAGYRFLVPSSLRSEASDSLQPDAVSA